MSPDDLLAVNNDGIKKTLYGSRLLDQGIQSQQVVVQEGDTRIIGKIVKAHLSRFDGLQIELLFLPGKNDKA